MTEANSKLDAVINSTGFIAALDQSGGSTPKALAQYGVSESEYSSDDEMFAKVHEMRTRIMTNEHFTSDKIMAAILFENTMDREVNGQPTATYLWETKGIIPILKVDKGLADEADGVQLMKPMPDLDALLDRAVAAGIWGTKMRSVMISKAKKSLCSSSTPASMSALTHSLARFCACSLVIVLKCCRCLPSLRCTFP